MGHLSLPLACKPEWKAYSEVLPSHSNYNLLHRLNRPFASNEINRKFVRKGNPTRYKRSAVAFGGKIINISLGLLTEFENRGKNIIEIGHDFYDIWWLLKEPFVLAVNTHK